MEDDAGRIESSVQNANFIEKSIKEYHALCAIPSLTSGRLCFNEKRKEDGEIDATITSKWSQRDLGQKENRTFQRNHIVTCDRDPRKVGPVQEPSFPVELRNIQLSVRSPSGKLQAIVRTIPATKKDDEKQLLEIWSCNNMVNSVDIKAADKHGSICEDLHFGSLQWSPTETQLLYVAEKKKDKTASYFETNNKDENSSKSQPKKGVQHDYEGSWGEQLTKRHHPVLAVFDVTTGDINVIDGIPDDLSAGQALWSPEGSGVVFSGWWHEPYHLGLMYCSNRRSGIFYVSLDGTGFEQLSKDGDAVLTPRFNPQMDKLVYLARQAKGVHMCCLRLMQFDWESKTTSTIVETVDTPRADGFAGIYCMSGLPTRCWSSDGTKIVLGSFWRSTMKILIVDLQSKSVINCTEENGCWNVLDVQGDFILASFSSPSQPHRLMMAPLLPSGTSEWTVIVAPSAAENIKWEIIKLTQNTAGSNKEYEAVLIQPCSHHTKPQLIVHAHGGPQSCYPSNYLIDYAALCRLGYAVVSVNYSGSLGFGQQHLESLIGNIGTQDVLEVKFAADTMLKTEKFDQDNVFVMGGSHGGFLACHLVGQYPGFFSAVVMRNPVINIVTMVGISDIPDWAFEEAGLDFDDELLSDADTYAKLLACSPIVHAKKIVTPTMLMLGELDLRVPPSQGKELYRTLKARGVEVRLLVYPEDNHPLSKVETESDAFVNISRWFHEHQTAS